MSIPDLHLKFRKEREVLIDVILTIPAGIHLDTFNIILQKALSTWDKAPSEWKSLHDVLAYGALLREDRPLTSINSTDDSNPELYHTKEQIIIKKFINNNGVEAWRKHIIENTTHFVLSEKVR